MQQPRKRINIPKTGSEEPVVDDLEFIKNKCSDRVRKVLTFIETIELELCFDKHYYDRLQHGDSDGERGGIDKKSVEKLVLEGMKHLLLYSSYVEGFTFINHEPLAFRAIRVVLKTPKDGTILNVVIEAHYLHINKYEITVKTAMCQDDFKMSDGQYSVEIDGVNSILCKNKMGKRVEICDF